MPVHFAIALLLLAQTPSETALFESLKSGRYTEALRMAETLLEAQPTDPRLWTARGLACKGLGRTSEGLTAFETALKISPRYLPALEAGAETAYAKRSPKAAAFLKGILELQPGNETAHAMSGVVAFETNDCADAVSHFEKSRNTIARNEIALLQFGYCLLATSRAREAAGVFATALAVNPSNMTTQYNLGLAEFTAAEEAAAISTLKPLVGHSGFDADVLNLLAAAYATQDRLQNAIEALRKATEIAPGDERNYLDLAVLCMEHQAPDLALETLTVGLKRIPESARLYTMRGAVHATTGQVEKAEADFEAAERLMPDELYGSVGLSLLFRQTNEIDRSLTILREKLRNAPDDPTLNFLLGDALLRKEVDPRPETLNEARSALLHSVDVKPDFAKAHAELGRLYLKSDEMDKAVLHLRLALKLDPQDRVALNQLAMALNQLGRTEEARQVGSQLRTLLQVERENESRRNRSSLVKAPPAR